MQALGMSPIFNGDDDYQSKELMIVWWATEKSKQPLAM